MQSHVNILKSVNLRWNWDFVYDLFIIVCILSFLFKSYIEISDSINGGPISYPQVTSWILFILSCSNQFLGDWNMELFASYLKYFTESFWILLSNCLYYIESALLKLSACFCYVGSKWLKLSDCSSHIESIGWNNLTESVTLTLSD